MSLRTRISGLEWDLECTSHGSCPKGRKKQKKALSKAERRLGKLELFAELCEEEEKPERGLQEAITWLWETGAAYGCGCGCGGILLEQLISARDSGFKTLEAWRDYQSNWEKEQLVNEYWEYWETRTQQILATSEALCISFQKAEALWEEVASS